MTTAPAFIAYYRVSTQAQGRSGLGLEAQREAVARHAAALGGQVVQEFTEVESGKRNDRPQLAAALAACRAQGAVLCIAKLDRLARNARFLLSVVEGAGEAGVAFCDLPQLPPGPAGRFMLTMFAAVAELEAGMISQRTKAALEAAKARGVKLGNPQLQPGTPATAKAASDVARAKAATKARDVMPYVEAAQKAGASTLQQIAQALEARGVRAPRGGTRWAPAQVARVMKVAA
ncbi:MAG: recombinase family protein [Phenylobacterium sp.]|uniref:recombinase family protein n=2 Tax=Phenylobacterium sp. TaxID=1871053 RepID=UPI0025FD877E|nr:recombinase family protein [Phenylobacterium sp.]MCA6232122.1 recombinase family protein [Phenylobacterium sp.]